MPNDLNINDPELEEDEIIQPDPADEQELDESTTDFFKSLAVSTPTETDPESIDPAGITVNNDELQKILKAIKIAKQDWLNNVKESGPNNTGSPRILQMQQNTGAIAQAWCASAVTTWWKESGLLPSNWKGSASVVAWTEWAKKNKRWSKTPMPGAAIIYDFVGGRSAGGDHIGLCVAVEGGKVASIDGNYGDKVSAYQPNLATVLGYVLPVTSNITNISNDLLSEVKLADFKKSKPQKYS
jgi:hypothetical protein